MYIYIYIFTVYMCIYIYIYMWKIDSVISNIIQFTGFNIKYTMLGLEHAGNALRF